MNLRKIAIPCTKNSMSNCRHNYFELPGWLVAIHSLRAIIASLRSNQFLSEILTFFIKCQILQPRNDLRRSQTKQNTLLTYVSTIGASMCHGNFNAVNYVLYTHQNGWEFGEISNQYNDIELQNNEQEPTDPN